MIEVELPDGSIAEFEDGTPMEKVQAAVASFGKPKAPTIKERAAAEVAKMGPWEKSMYGLDRSFDESAMGLKQIFPKALGGGLTKEDEEGLALRREMESQIPGFVSRFTGDIAQFAAPTGKVIAAAKAIPKLAPAAAGYLGAVGAGAGQGAIKPVLEGEDRGENAATGGMFGAAGKLVGDTVGRGIEGLIAKNPSIAKLPQKIRDSLTLGQTADRDTLLGRMASATEEKLQSIPLVGDLIRNARQGSTERWRDDLLQSVAPKGHTVSGANTREKLDDTYRAYQSRYGAALRNHQVNPSQLFETQVLNITNNPRSGLTQAQQEEVRNMVMRYYTSMFHGNNPATGPAGTAAALQGGARGSPISADAETAKSFEAFLTKQASQYAKSNAPGASNMAQMFDDLERAWSVSYRRQLPSSARMATKELDQGYAPYKTAERAGGYVGNDFGDFTPQQLLTAVRARTPANRFARGKGILQDEVQTARDTIIDRVPNSGTADRSTLAAVAGGLWADPVTAVATLGTAVPLMTTRAGRNMMTGDTKAQKLLQRLRVNDKIRDFGPVAGPSFADIIDDPYQE